MSYLLTTAYIINKCEKCLHKPNICYVQDTSADKGSMKGRIPGLMELLF